MDLSRIPFLQLVGLFGLASSLMFFMASIIPSWRSHTSRVAGIMVVVALCFTANNAWVYFGGIFIVATGLTSVEFLEKLAAIITRNPGYWQYLIGHEESLSTKLG